jgi:hypothetical protein
MFVRVVAHCCEGAYVDKNHKFTLLCGIDDDKHRIEDGEWMGYIKYDGVFYPFILEDGRSCFYGYEKHSAQRTNIGEKVIQEGTQFTVFGEPGTKDEYVFKIASIAPPDRANVARVGAAPKASSSSTG